MRLLEKLRVSPKKLSALVAIAAAVITVPAALYAWGPDRPTFTIEKPATYVTFNSITNNPIDGDERNFVRAKDTSQTTPSAWKDDLVVSSGKEYKVRMLVHNNAADNLNLKALNTRVKAAVPGTTGKKTTISGFVSADNAKPGEVWDDVNFTSSQDFNLVYVAGSARIYNNGYAAGGSGQPLPDSIVTSTGAKVGYEKAGDGIIPGCFKYLSYVEFTVKPQFAATADFTMSKLVSKHGANKWVDNYAAQPGEIVDYLVQYKNTGDAQQNNVTIRDKLPSGVSYVNGSSVLGNSQHPSGIKTNDGIADKGLNIGSYAKNGNAWVIFSAKLPSKDATKCGKQTLRNVASVETDFGTKDDVADVTVEGECKPPVAKYTCDALSVQKLSRTSFKFSTAYTVENATFKNVVYVVRDSQGNEIYRGGDATYDQQRVGAYTVQAYVTVTVDGQDKTVTSDNCKKSFEVTKEKENTPGVSIEKKVDGVEHKKVAVNEEYTYQLVVKNTGEVDLKNVVVRDPAPKNVQFISADKGTITNNVWTYTIPELKIGASQTFAIKAKVAAETTGNIVNTACVDAPEVPGNPDDCDTATVEVPPKTTGQIKVCDLTTKQVVFIDESDYDETKYTTDLSKCAEEEELPSELPVTGAADIVAKLAGVVSLAGATTYYIASRRNS